MTVEKENQSSPGLRPMIVYLTPSGQPEIHFHTINSKWTQQGIFIYPHICVLLYVVILIKKRI